MEKLSAPPISEDTQQVFCRQAVRKYINHPLLAQSFDPLQKSAKHQSRVCLPKVKTCTRCTCFLTLPWSCFLNTIDPDVSDYIGSDLEINNKILMFPLLDYTSARQVICPKFYTARFWGQKLNTLIARKLQLFSLTIHRCKIYTVNALISVFWVVHTSCLSKTITAAGCVKKFSQVQNFPIGTQKTLYTQHKILHQFCR